MAAYPNIIDAVGSYDPADGAILAMALFTNSGGNGYIATNLYDGATHILKNTISKCYDAKTRLAYKSMIGFIGSTNYIDVTLGNCAAGESCNPPSCSSVNITSGLTGMPVYMVDYSIPPSPAGVNVVSGNGILTFGWNKNTNIFAYYLVLTDPSLNVVDSGYLWNDANSHTFGDLTNGIVYTLHIYNVNRSNIPSSEITISGVPVGPIITPTPTTPTTTIPPGGEGISPAWIIAGVAGIGVIIYLSTRGR